MLMIYNRRISNLKWICEITYLSSASTSLRFIFDFKNEKRILNSKIQNSKILHNNLYKIWLTWYSLFFFFIISWLDIYLFIFIVSWYSLFSSSQFDSHSSFFLLDDKIISRCDKRTTFPHLILVVYLFVLKWLCKYHYSQ